MELDVIASAPVTMAELKDKLESVKKVAKEKELNFRASKVVEFLNELPLSDVKKVAEWKQKIGELNVPRLKEKHIVKIIDILPENADELKSLLVGENITIKNDDLVKIVEVLKA